MRHLKQQNALSPSATVSSGKHEKGHLKEGTILGSGPTFMQHLTGRDAHGVVDERPVLVGVVLGARGEHDLQSETLGVVHRHPAVADSAGLSGRGGPIVLRLGSAMCIQYHLALAEATTC